MRDLRIIFMGTPEFAVESLKALVNHDFNVVAVITAPDKPKGRGQKLSISPVKEFALSQEIPVLQPTNLKSEAFNKELKSYQANLQVVVAFRMLPEVVWSMPEYGTFNLHASLLPQYRGAAPINWAIMNGEKETGVTTFFIQHEIDTGNIILQEKEPIFPTDTVGTLYERLMRRGAEVVCQTVEQIKENSFALHVQKDSDELKAAPKLFKQDCEIDWSRSSKDIYNFIRGLSPYPAAWCELAGKNFKIFDSEISDLPLEGKSGEILSDGKETLLIKTGDGAIRINVLQQEGKKRMEIKDFLRGNKL